MIANITSSSRTDPGKVMMRPAGKLSFEVYCTVPRCRHARFVIGHGNAKKHAFDHASAHINGSA